MSATKDRKEGETLDYPYLFYVLAGEGWLELGNASEAIRELDQMPPEHRDHPDVLHLRWHIHASIGKWDYCLSAAKALTDSAPDDPRGWIILAETYYRKRDVQKAYRIALANSADFPESWHLLYDTACYACLLGKPTEAKQFLRRAMTVGDREEIKRRALEDPDLADLWKSGPARFF
jgi:predicted Zn-dependent protease